MAILGALMITGMGMYLVVAGGELSVIGWMLVVIGAALLPLNLYLRSLGVRAGVQNPFRRR